MSDTGWIFEGYGEEASVHRDGYGAWHVEYDGDVYPFEIERRYGNGVNLYRLGGTRTTVKGTFKDLAEYVVATVTEARIERQASDTEGMTP